MKTLRLVAEDSSDKDASDVKSKKLVSFWVRLLVDSSFSAIDLPSISMSPRYVGSTKQYVDLHIRVDIFAARPLKKNVTWVKWRKMHSCRVACRP